MLEGKELEGSVGTINGEPIVKYSLDITEDGELIVEVSASMKVDLLEKVEELLAKTSIGAKVVAFLEKLKSK